MYFSSITKESYMEGPGFRVVLWCSGCEHSCPGCQNPETHNPKLGKQFTLKDLQDIVEYLDKKHISGLTLCGGDPLYPANIPMVTEVVKYVKHQLPNKTIWCYTGYLWEDVQNLELMEYVDVLIDGPFIMEKLDVNYPYAGSTNQRIINVQESLKNDKVILVEV